MITGEYVGSLIPNTVSFPWVACILSRLVLYYGAVIAVSVLCRKFSAT